MPWPHLCLSLCLLLLVLPTAQANQASLLQGIDEWQSPSYIQKAFNEIALKNEYQKTQHRILKWQTPIVYQFIYHDLPQNLDLETLFKKHLKHLHLITQHPIQALTDINTSQLPAQPNLLIHLTRDINYARVIQQVSRTTVKSLARESHCMGTFRKNGQGAIEQGVIIIPVDHVYSRGLLVSCIVEESTQLMGLPNDSDWVNPSIANDASKVELLTGLDYLFLKILYNPKLKVGMPMSLSQPIIKQIIDELRNEGMIEKAQQEVNRHGLYPILN